MKKIIRNKKGLFEMLDFYAILILAAGMLILFIIVSFMSKSNTKDIEKEVEAIHHPHFVLNAFESEIIDMSDCPAASVNMTRKDALIWFDSNKKEIAEDSNTYKDCISQFRKSIDDLSLNNVGDSAEPYHLFLDINIPGWNSELELSIDCGDNIDFYICKTTPVSIFSFTIPSKNTNIIVQINKAYLELYRSR